MINEKKNILYSLISLDDFKCLLGIDDRDDKIARFCLVTSTLTIEQYCKRKFLKKKHTDYFTYSRENFFILREYPISINSEKLIFNNEMILDKKYYSVIPDCGSGEDIPCSIEFSDEITRLYRFKYFKVVYTAGYVVNPYPCGFTTWSFCETKTPAKAKKTAASMPQIPADLAAACFELAAWNFARYKGKRVGMEGNIRKDGDRLEMAMPNNVKSLLEPYRRKTI